MIKIYGGIFPSSASSRFCLGSELFENPEIFLSENVIVIFPPLLTFAFAFSGCDPAIPILPGLWGSARS